MAESRVLPLISFCRAFMVNLAQKNIKKHVWTAALGFFSNPVADSGSVLGFFWITCPVFCLVASCLALTYIITGLVGLMENLQK